MCLYSNIQSFHSKKREIELYLAQNRLDMLFFTEIWLGDQHHESEFSLSNFQSPIIDRNQRGGACAFVRAGLNYVPQTPPYTVKESVWFSVKTANNITRLYSCIYRSPNSDSQNNENLLLNIEWARRQFDEIIMVGDINMPNINWSTEQCSNEYGQKLLDCLNDNNLEQLVDQPTRYRFDQNPSLLDLIITSNPDIVHNVEYFEPFGKSDHISIHFTAKNEVSEDLQDKIIFDYKKMNEEIFCDIISSHDWAAKFDNTMLNTSYDQFLYIVNGAINDAVPMRRLNNRKNAPWATNHVNNLSNKKRQKWDKYKHSRAPRDYEDYKIALNKFTEEKDKAILRYENNVIAQKNTNPKKYHNYVSRKNKYSHNKICLKNGNILETKDENCANILNEYFGSVFSRGPSQIPQIDNLPGCTMMPDVVFSLENITKKLQELDTSKSCGPDGVPASLLKKFHFIFAPILLIIFRKSYEIGDVPEKMKMANVSPLYKSGDKTCPSNFRPVSVTPIIAKMFEGIMYDNIVSHINNNNIMCPQQHGFLKDHSTNTNLLHFWNDVSNLADRTQEITIVYTDLRKAFDSVPHDLLLEKLRSYGIGGRNLGWIESFLENRQQRVKINNAVSRTIPIESGVPQGGVLSGVLFNLYINDMPQCLKYLKASLYADDAKLYGTNNNSDNSQAIQDDLNAVTQWCNKWRLRLNAQKCFFLHYRPQKCNNPFPEYFIDGVNLPRKERARDLGIIISDNLKFHDQVANACKKATKEINIVRRSFVSRNPNFLSNMFKIYVRPHLEYCGQVWNPVYSGDALALEKVQNRFTRMLPYGYIMPPEERNRVLGITDHRTRRLRGDLIYMYKLLDEGDLFTPLGNSRTRGHSRRLYVPPARNNLRKHSFSLRAVSIWNSLPDDVVTSASLDIFKSKIDNIL